MRRLARAGNWVADRLACGIISVLFAVGRLECRTCGRMVCEERTHHG